jgi:hypothetical protein
MLLRNVRTRLCHVTEDHSGNLHCIENAKSYRLYAEAACLDRLFVCLFVIRFRRRDELWELPAVPARLQNLSMRVVAFCTIASSTRYICDTHYIRLVGHWK